MNRLIVGLEQTLLAVFRGAQPLQNIIDDPSLFSLYALIDVNPHQAVLMTRIKTSHSMTPRHGINVLLTLRAWVVQAHKLGAKRDPLCLAALVHDMGHWQDHDLVFVFGQFTKDEYRRMQKHTVLDEEALRAVDPDILTWIRDHHEQPDGRGYPNRITNPHILAQVIRIVDCYEGLTTPRRFRPAYTPGEAMKLMARWSGYKYNAALFTSFQDFMGVYPAGTQLRTQHGGGLALPPCGQDGQPVLLTTNEQGDTLEEPLEKVIPHQEVDGEGRSWHDTQLPGNWENLRPDWLGLPRSYALEA